MAAAPENAATISETRPDADPSETREWMESVDVLVDHAGQTRARALSAS